MESLTLKPEDLSGADLSTITDALARAEPSVTAEQLPTPLVELLRNVVASLSAGNEVTVLSRDAELTPAQAARVLGVSRAYVSLLINNGKLPSRKVGTHHRIALGDVTALRRKRDALAGLREMV